MRFDVDNNTSEVVRKILTRMKIEGINSKNLKKKLRREPKKNTSKRPFRQRAAMYHRRSFNLPSLRKVVKEKVTLNERSIESDK